MLYMLMLLFMLFIYLFWMLFRSAFKCAFSHTSCQPKININDFIYKVCDLWGEILIMLVFFIQPEIPWKLHWTVSNSWWVWISLAVLAASTLSRSVALALETDVLYDAWFRRHGGR